MSSRVRLSKKAGALRLKRFFGDALGDLEKLQARARDAGIQKRILILSFQSSVNDFIAYKAAEDGYITSLLLSGDKDLTVFFRLKCDPLESGEEKDHVLAWTIGEPQPRPVWGLPGSD